MSTDFPADSPLRGIEFTREELVGFIHNFSEEYDPKIIEEKNITYVGLKSGADFLITAFRTLSFVTDESALSESELLADEELIAHVAQKVIGALRTSIPLERNRRTVAEEKEMRATINLLAPFTDTPRKRKHQEAEQRAKIEAKQHEIAELNERIHQIENPYLTTGKERRALSYTVNGVIRNGAWLANKISSVTSNGSDTPVFSEKSANMFAGLSLKSRTMTETDMNTLRERMNEVAKLQQSIARKGGQSESIVFVAIQILNEVHDELDTHKHTEIRPLIDFADRLLTQLDATLDPEFIDTLADGPFKLCEKLEIKPFTGTGQGGRVTATVIDSEDLSAQDIEDDIEAAIKRHRGTYVVEPQRISDFIRLRAQLIDTHGPQKIRTIRTQSSQWHPLPWYALEITFPNHDKPLAVIESPILGNATYVIDNSDWIGTLYYRRREARGKGAEQNPHSQQRATPHLDHLSQRIKLGKLHG